MKDSQVPKRVNGNYPQNPLQKARLNAGVTQERAAKAIGCSVRALQRYEGGTRAPNARQLQKMAECYSCDIRDLFG